MNFLIVYRKDNSFISLAENLLTFLIKMLKNDLYHDIAFKYEMFLLSVS